MGLFKLRQAHRPGFETGHDNRHLGDLRQCQAVQPRSKTQFRHMKTRPQPRGQVVAVQKHVPRFRQTAAEAEIRIVEPGRDRDAARPVKLRVAGGVRIG